MGPLLRVKSLELPWAWERGEGSWPKKISSPNCHQQTDTYQDFVFQKIFPISNIEMFRRIIMIKTKIKKEHIII